MQELRRTRAGPFKEDETLTNLHQLSAAQSDFEAGDDAPLMKIIQPMELALNQLPKIIIRDSAVDAVCHGAELALPGVVRLDSAIDRNRLVALFTMKGEAIALGRSQLTSREILDQEKGIAAKVERVIMERGTYPAMWKH